MATARQIRWHEIFERRDPTDPATIVVNYGIVALILLNVLALVLSTERRIELAYGNFLEFVQFVCVVAFTAEYAVRIWSCAAVPEYAGRRGRARFAGTPLMVIDFLVILPFIAYVVGRIFFGVPQGHVIRSLTLLAILRPFKLFRYSPALQTLGRVVRAKRDELAFAFGIIMILLLVASTAEYFIEHVVQPEKFSSIPASAWWGIETLTTVGYGDVTPVTPLGKLVGGAIALMGIAMFALPAGILSSGFSEEIARRHRAERVTCPQCGTRFDAHGNP